MVEMTVCSMPIKLNPINEVWVEKCIIKTDHGFWSMYGLAQCIRSKLPTKYWNIYGGFTEGACDHQGKSSLWEQTCLIKYCWIRMTFDYDISFLWIYAISGNPKHLLMHDTQNHYQYLSRHLNIMINTISNCGSQIDTTVKQLPKICPQNKARVCTKNSFTINNTSTSYYIPRFSPGLLVSQPVQPDFNQ